MKLTITQTFTATKTTCRELVKNGIKTGMFMEKGDVAPLWVWQEYAWIQANPRKVIYLLEDEETAVCLK